MFASSDYISYIEFALALIAFLLIAWGWNIWYAAQKQRAKEDRADHINAELKLLVDVRGEKIEDLEAALAAERVERRAEAQKFREELAELRGQVEAIRHLKAEEIAESVVAQADAIADAVVKRLHP